MILDYRFLIADFCPAILFIELFFGDKYKKVSVFMRPHFFRKKSNMQWQKISRHELHKLARIEMR
jgi:hypothetical protein